jgi:hypothetical protein
MMVFSPGSLMLDPNGMVNSTLTVFTNSTTPIGTYDLVVIVSSGAVLHFVSIFLTVESPLDFSLAPSFDDVSFPSGSTGDSRIFVTGLNGFTGTISYTSSPNPTTGLAATCASVTLTTTTTAETSTCSFSSSTPGTYSVILAGKAEQPVLSHQAIIFVIVNQPRNSPIITTDLSASTVTAGGSVTDTAILTGATNAAGGTVTYQLFTGSLCTGTGTTVGSPVAVTNGNVPVSASQTFSSPGSFTWDAIYSGDIDNNAATSLCETLTVIPVTQADFTLSVSSTSLTIPQDQRGTAKVTLQSLGFTGRVHLTATISPRVHQGIFAHLKNQTITLSNDTVSQTVLVISTGDDIPAGTFNITITAVSGSISHSVQLTITVSGETGHEGCDPLQKDR